MGARKIMINERYKVGKRSSDNWDRVFRALSADPRRQLLVSLLDSRPEESVSLPEGAMNPAVPVDPGPLEAELYHRHLPLLTEFGFVDWETDPFVAVRGPRFDEVAVVFEAIHAFGDVPDPLAVGWQRLEQGRREEQSDYA